MQLTILKANEKDIDKIANLFDLYRQFYKQPANLSESKQFIKERVSESSSVIFYAINEYQEPLGFTQIYPTFSSVSASRQFILNDLFVIKNVRGSGVGKALLNQAKFFAQQQGANTIQLSTAKANFSAQKLYESLGYQKNNEFYYYELPIRE